MATCNTKCTGQCANGCGEGCSLVCSKICYGNAGSGCGGACSTDCVNGCGESANLCGNGTTCGSYCGGNCAKICMAGCDESSTGSSGGGCFDCTSYCASCTSCTNECGSQCGTSCKNTCNSKCTDNCNNGCTGTENTRIYTDLKLQILIKEEDITPLRTLLISEILRRNKNPDTSSEDLVKVDLLVLYQTAKELYTNIVLGEKSTYQYSNNETTNRATMLDYIKLAKQMYEQCIPAK